MEEEVEEEEEGTSVHDSHVSGSGNVNNHSLFQKKTDWNDATYKTDRHQQAVL
jgi:hypothetical protein